MGLGRWLSSTTTQEQGHLLDSPTPMRQPTRSRVHANEPRGGKAEAGSSLGLVGKLV